jgi:hypothetical protein
MTYCPFSIVFKKSINWQYPRSQLLVFAHGWLISLLLYSWH